MMESFRNNPPQTLAGSPVVSLLDYEKRISTDLQSGKQAPIELPKSNVLQFVTADGTKVSARPSGTEPKIKFYFSVNAPLPSVDDFKKVEGELKQKIQTIISELAL